MSDYALLSLSGSPLSHADLSLLTRELAREVARCGIEPEDVVALVLPDGPEFLAVFLAVSQFAACAPLNPAFTAAEFQFALSDIRPATVIVEAGAVSPASAVAKSLGIGIIEAQFSPMLFRGSSRPLRDSRRSPAGLLLHTSATTGDPKLVLLTNALLGAMGDVTIRALQLTAADRFLSVMPLFHAQGLLASLGQLRAGGAVIATPGFAAGTFTAAVREYAPTWYTGTAAVHRAVVAVADGMRFRFVRSIGAALPLDLLERIEASLETPVIEGYGMTETGTATTNPLPPGKRKPGSAGKSAGPEIRLVDGEILLRGPSVITTYADERFNEGAFVDGWLRTGDLGRFDEDGYLYITGRKKEIISRGGEKIRPSEIDAVLAAHPAVAEVAAFGVPHSALGEDVAAAVVLHDDRRATESELREFAGTSLAAFKIPRTIHIVESIPKSATGKPRRSVLATRFGAAATTEAVRGDIEEKIAGIWEKLLRVSGVGATDNFFALGGDSLAAALMLTEVQAEFPVAESLLDHTEFFDEPTPRALAAIVGRVGSGAAEPLAAARVVALQRRGDRPPVFAMPWAGDDPFYFRYVARHLGPDQPFYSVRNTRPVDSVLSVEELAAEACETIRSVRAARPCILAGHCFGGIVAFETARRFVAAGERVLAVLLFDTPTPGYPKLRRSHSRYWRYLLESRGRIRPSSVFAHARTVGRLVKRKAVAKVERTVPVLAPRAAGVHEANHQSARMYIPGPVTVPVFQFLAADESLTARVLEDPRLGWGDFARCGFDVRRAGGTHATMFLEPHAAELASQVESVLREIPHS